MVTAVKETAQSEGQAARPLSQYRLTYRDIPALPDYLECYEIWEGELVVNPAPSFNHQLLVARLMQAFALHDPDFEHGVYITAPSDVVLSETITVQPDIYYVSSARRDIIKAQYVHGAPDLCIEILSPRTADDDLTRKRSYYREHGVREYWIVNPFDQTLTVCDLAHDGEVEYGAGQTATSSLEALQGLRVAVSKLFKAL